MFTREQFIPPKGDVGLGAYVREFIRRLNVPGAINLAGQTLEDYGTWTPVLSFATPGDLSVSYTTQLGWWVKNGRLISVEFFILTSAFTHTTASGGVQITGLPSTFTANETNSRPVGALQFGGITFNTVGQTSAVCKISGNSNTIVIAGSGTGVATSNLSANSFPTGGTVTLIGSLHYIASA